MTFRNIDYHQKNAKFSAKTKTKNRTIKNILLENIEGNIQYNDVKLIL